MASAVLALPSGPPLPPPPCAGGDAVPAPPGTSVLGDRALWGQPWGPGSPRRDGGLALREGQLRQRRWLPSLGRWTRMPGRSRRPWSFQSPLCCLWLGTPASPKLSALPTSKTDREQRPGLCWERSGRLPCTQPVLNKRSLPRCRRGEPLLGPPPHTPGDRCAVPTSHEKCAARGQPCKHRSESGSQPRGCAHPQVTDVQTADPGCQGWGTAWGQGFF